MDPINATGNPITAINKIARERIQRDFPPDLQEKAAAILTSSFGTDLPLPNEPYASREYLEDWRFKIQIDVLNLARGDIQTLQRYAQTAQGMSAHRFAWRLRNDEEALGEARRGIDTLDYNNSLTLVRAPLADVTAAFAHKAVAVEENVLGQSVCLGREALLLFRLRGNPWTNIVQYGDYASVLRENWEQVISRRLKTRVISYGRSDTASCVHYRLYDTGQFLEELNDQGCAQGDTGYFSRLRDVSVDDVTPSNLHTLADQFFRNEDAFESGITFEYFVGGEHRYRRGSTTDTVVVRNSYRERHLGYEGGRLLEQVDFVCLAR